MSFAPYQSATGCTKYGPAGAQAFVTYTEDVFVELHRLMGICNCREVVGGSAWSHHAECRACDNGFIIVANMAYGYQYTLILAEKAEKIGCDHIITNAQPWASGRGMPMIFSARSPKGREYTGLHPHKDHNHTGFTRNSGRYLTYATIVSVYGTPQEMAMKLMLQEGTYTMLAPCKIGDSGPHVVALQAMLKACSKIFPACDPGDIDGAYGPKTSAGLLGARKTQGSAATSGDVFNHYGYEQLHGVHVRTIAAIYGLGESSGGDHPDSDHDGLATKASVADLASQMSAHVSSKLSGPHN